SGLVTFDVYDNDTQATGNAAPNNFDFVSTPAVSRLVPSLTSILGGDKIYVRGSNFKSTDTIYLERDDGSGSFDIMTPALNGATFIDSTKWVFNAPVHKKGGWRVYVQDLFGQPANAMQKARILSYFQFTDF